MGISTVVYEWREKKRRESEARTKATLSQGRQEVIEELEAKGVEVPDEVKAKSPNPPSNE